MSYDAGEHIGYVFLLKKCGIVACIASRLTEFTQQSVSLVSQEPPWTTITFDLVLEYVVSSRDRFHGVWLAVFAVGTDVSGEGRVY